MDKFTESVGFGDAPELPIKHVPESSIEFIGDCYIGVNPDDLDGCWDTREEALINFATQFEKFVGQAKGKCFLVRRVPHLMHERSFESGRVRWKMIGRFSIPTLKERNT
tara:strand:- start:635 stop:961 length:327 start_codon:yes stop_codon:yes gene_type:complete